MKGEWQLKTAMGLFLILATVSITGSIWLHQNGYLDFFTAGTAAIAAQGIRLIGLQATVLGNNIELSHQSWLVTLECTAIYLMALYGSFVVSYPAKPLAKLIGVALGIPIIFAANILRLILLAVAVEYLPGYFHAFHDYVWQVGFVFLVVALWFAWIQWLAGNERQSAIPA